MEEENKKKTDEILGKDVVPIRVNQFNVEWSEQRVVEPNI